ncbi:ATPase, T2SS/T4P/T4SS family [Mycolicibacterium hippocampi]|uniref:ATPase, T2SS/T4P/T4SS family n=1 Tax=Mycolicibacterium hippocampi TaxID=659824 RepID=UPI003FCCEF9D
MLPPVAAAGTCLSLRAAARQSGSRCARRVGAVAAEAAELLRGIIDARLAFVVSGGTGAGKTTLLAAMLGAVATDERIVCVEDAPSSRPGTLIW